MSLQEIMGSQAMMSSQEIGLIYPELWVLGMTCFILLFDVMLGKRSGSVTYLLSQFTLLIAFLLTTLHFDVAPTTLFSQTFVFDPISNVLKLFIFGFGILGFSFSRKYVAEHSTFGGEYYILTLFSILGMMILVSASSFLTLYLGVELLTLPLYALIAMAKAEKQAAEAAMKYFVLGAIASGMLLFGISLLYGATGSFEIPTIAKHLAQLAQPESHSKMTMTILYGMVFVLSGLAFKLGAVPFHMWIPDVYQGAPTSVTLFIATLPELAGFGMAIRILPETFPALASQWQPLLVLISVLSLAIGNIAALAQNNIKRMLAYSTIGHIGFVFLGLLAGPEAGYAAALAYIIIYTLMALGAFGIVVALSRKGFEAENISDFQGLGKTQPMVAFLMLLVFFSLAGIPPLVGFYAKFIVLDALIKAGYVWLAIIAVIFSVIGAFYYLRVIRVMYFENPKEVMEVGSKTPEIISRSRVALLSVNGILQLGLGIFPAPLINLCLETLRGYNL